jgi:hypothetical protein
MAINDQYHIPHRDMYIIIYFTKLDPHIMLYIYTPYARRMTIKLGNRRCNEDGACTLITHEIALPACLSIYLAYASWS